MNFRLSDIRSIVGVMKSIDAGLYRSIVGYGIDLQRAKNGLSHYSAADIVLEAVWK